MMLSAPDPRQMDNSITNNWPPDNTPLERLVTTPAEWERPYLEQRQGRKE
jgi:hypothetical protein